MDAEAQDLPHLRTLEDRLRKEARWARRKQLDGLANELDAAARWASTSADHIRTQQLHEAGYSAG